MTAVRIYQYSFEYSEQKCDVAIVLGAGTSNGKVSPIFKERINHGIYLYKQHLVNKIILTGGRGKGQSQADSEVAKTYAQQQGVPVHDIIIETKSKYTINNLTESKRIMDSLGLKSVLLVSDPLHMKRSVDLAKKLNLNCSASPTQTSMYQSFIPKFKSLMYESFYYCVGELTCKN